jgi:hypothetical protein
MVGTMASTRMFELDPATWRLLGRQWRQRDPMALRREVFERLDTAAEGWGDLAFAIFSNVDPHTGTRLATSGDLRVQEVRAIARTALRRMLAERDLDPFDRAVLGTFVYFECLCAWERTDYYDELTAIVEELCSLATTTLGIDVGRQPLPAVDALTDPASTCRALLHAAVLLARTLEDQFQVENALFCSCPTDLTRQAGRVLDMDAVAPDGVDVQGTLELLEHIATHGDESARQLASLLAQDARTVLRCFGVLHEHVGPAAGAFVDQLAPQLDVEVEQGVELPDPAALASQLESAARAARAGQAELEADVLASEIRAHAQTLAQMRRAVTDEQDVLLVEDGGVSLIYPFGMPQIVSPGDVVRRLLHPHGGVSEDDPEQLARLRREAQEGLHLLGLPVLVIPGSETDAWGATGSELSSDTSLFSVRLELLAHHLVIQTTHPTRHVGVTVEVHLSSLGNHHVRIATSTDVPVCFTEDDADDPDATWTPVRYGAEGRTLWTPHDLEQWIRRANREMGSERIWFADRHDPEGTMAVVDLGDGTATQPDLSATTGTPTDEPTTFEQLVEVAEAVADAVPSLLERVLGDRYADVDAPTEHNDLAEHAHVVLQIRDASRLPRDPDAPPSPITSPNELPELLGGSTLFLRQRPFASALEEWVRYPPAAPVNLLADHGFPGDLLHRNDDVTLLCTFASPNWVSVEYLEMVEFTASLTGLYSAWRVWLAAQDHHLERTSEEDLDHAQVLARLELLADSIQQVQSIREHVRSAHLTRTAVQRQLVHDLLGASEVPRIEVALDDKVASVQAAAGRLERLAEIRSERRLQRAERRLALLGVVLAVGGAAGLFEWLHSEDRAGNGLHLPLLEVTLVAIGVLLILWVLHHVDLRRDRTRHDRLLVRPSPLGRPDAATVHPVEGGAVARGR